VAGVFPSIVVAGEDLRRGLLKRGDAGLGLFDFGGVDVADGGDLGVAFADEPFEHVDEARAPVAEPEQGDADLGDGVGGEVKDGALQVGLGHALLEKGVEVFVGRLSLESAGGHEATQSQESTPEEFPSLHGPKLGVAGFNSAQPRACALQKHCGHGCAAAWHRRRVRSHKQHGRSWPWGPK